VPSAVQDVRFPDAGVPSAGVVNVGAVNVLLVSVVVLAAVTMFVGVMIDDRVAMSYPSALIFVVNDCNSASNSSFVGAGLIG
jgi:hypothetical protein